MLKTPFNKLHHEFGARMVDFAGWEMPLLYTGIIEEHNQVRNSGGLFDVSHMGRVWFTGPDVRRFLERLCTRRLSNMEPGQCRYALICNADGGVRDDVLVYRIDESEFMLVVNASNREKLLEHFAEIAGDLSVSVDDRTFTTAMVALQGPKVMELIGNFSQEIPALKRYRFTSKDLLMAKAMISRTGYTGEDGVEAIMPLSMAGVAMETLRREVDLKQPDAPVKPAGLGARDTLRMEAGMPLYGHELGEDIPAWASGLSFAIDLDKADHDPGEPFVGHEAVRPHAEKGAPHALVGLQIEGKRSARQGMPIQQDEYVVGYITSACVSPTLGRPIAMGYVDAAIANVGAALSIDANGRMIEATVVKMPFVKK